MILSDLRMLLFFLPMMTLIGILTPQKWRNLVLSVCGIVYCIFWGWKPLLFVMLSAAAGWFAVKAAPRSMKNGNAMKARAWIAIGMAVQGILLWFAPRGAQFPLLLCALQTLGCLLERVRGKLRAPALPQYFAYCLSFPRMLCCFPLTYAERHTLVKSRKITLERLGSGVGLIAVGIFEYNVLAIPMARFFIMLCETQISTALSLPDAWLGALSMFFMYYFRLQGLLNVGAGVLQMQGYDVTAFSDSPILADSIPNYIKRFWTPMYRFVTQILGISDENRFSMPLFSWFWRVLIICLGISLLFAEQFSTALLWGIVTAILLLVEHILEEKQLLQKLPHALRIVLTNLAVIVLLFALCGVNLMQQHGSLFSLFGTGGLLLSSNGKYAVSWYWLNLLLCILCIFPLRKLAEKCAERYKAAEAASVILVPAAEIAMLLFSAMQILSLYTE